RAVRWYTTLGLVDRPSAMRGRTALYGRRHLLQLVAIKRLQAAGRTLAEVQEELAAASDERLGRVADPPAARRAPPAARQGRAGRGRGGRARGGRPARHDRAACPPRGGGAGGRRRRGAAATG